jgi:hypothetical protein
MVVIRWFGLKQLVDGLAVTSMFFANQVSRRWFAER